MPDLVDHLLAGIERVVITGKLAIHGTGDVLSEEAAVVDPHHSITSTVHHERRNRESGQDGSNVGVEHVAKHRDRGPWAGARSLCLGEPSSKLRVSAQARRKHVDRGT